MASRSTGLTSQQVICRECKASNRAEAERCANCDALLGDEVEATMSGNGPRFEEAEQFGNKESGASASQASPSIFPAGGQSSAVAKRGYAEAMRFIEQFGVPGEEIEYIVTSAHSSPSGVAGCAIISNHRLITLKMVGMDKPIIDDCLWKDVHDVKMFDSPGGVTLVVTTVQDAQLTVEGLPKHQAQVVAGYGLMHSDKTHGKQRQTGQTLTRWATSPGLFLQDAEVKQAQTDLSMTQSHSPIDLLPSFDKPADTAKAVTGEQAHPQTDNGASLPLTGPQSLDALPIESLMQRTIQSSAPPTSQTVFSPTQTSGSLLQSIMKASQLQEADEQPEPVAEATSASSQYRSESTSYVHAPNHPETTEQQERTEGAEPEFVNPPVSLSESPVDPESVIEPATFSVETIQDEIYGQEFGDELLPELEGIAPFVPPTTSTPAESLLPSRPLSRGISQDVRRLQALMAEAAASSRSEHEPPASPHLATAPHPPEIDLESVAPELESDLDVSRVRTTNPHLESQEAFTSAELSTARIGERDLPEETPAQFIDLEVDQVTMMAESPLETEAGVEATEEVDAEVEAETGENELAEPQVELSASPLAVSMMTKRIAADSLSQEQSQDEPRQEPVDMTEPEITVAAMEGFHGTDIANISHANPTSEQPQASEVAIMEQPPMQSMQSSPMTSGALTTSGEFYATEHPTSGSLRARTPSTSLRARNSKSQEDLVQKMKQLRELLEIGLITEEEFMQKKTELLSRF